MALSPDPEIRARQLANLRPAPPAPKGNTRTLKHGARSAALIANVEDEVRAVLDALADAAPVRDADGALPTHDLIAVETAARALRRHRSVSGWCDENGRLDPETGEVRSAADYELRTERALTASLDALGMTPTARARLGLDLARTADLALEWAAEHDREQAES